MFYITKEKKLAFSLAEAMIALVIVALVTIASVPIIKKKRHDITSLDHGKWICTTNSRHDYVVWSSTEDIGDIDNPETWKKVINTKYEDVITYKDEFGVTQTKRRNKCVFEPPSKSKVRNFNVTVIGNGGGGHDGAAKYKPYLTATSTGGGSFVPNSSISDYYDIIVIGAGGGGGGSAGDGDSGPGGGGGGGAMFKGHLKLVKNGTYSYYVAGGGAGNSGRYHGGLSNSTSHGRADGGGTSGFSGNPNGQNINIQVPGGQGGDATGCSKWKCRGGDHGAGAGSSGITRSFPSDSNTSSAISSGNDGNYGQDYCKWPRYWTQGGVNSFDSFQTDSRNFPMKISYGNGGSGFYGCDGGNGQTGGSGAVIISQTEKTHGEGGKAGSMDSRFVPSIEGTLVVTVPKAAESGESGGSVKAELVNNKTQNGVFKQQSGGLGGGTNTTGPTNGENSPWTYKNGGNAAATCSSVSNISGGYYPVEKKALKCIKAACVLDEYDVTYLTANNIMGGVHTQPACLDSDWKQKENCTIEVYNKTAQGASDASFIVFIATKLKATYLALNGEIYKQMINIQEELSGYKNKSDFASAACYQDPPKLSYVGECMEDAYITVTEQEWRDTQRTQTCPAAGDGTAFGAGGGGGRAGDLNGIFSKGGKGSPGAVIIEW